MARFVLILVVVLAAQAHGSQLSDFVDHIKSEFSKARTQAEQFVSQFTKQMETVAAEEDAKIKAEVQKFKEQMKISLADIIAKGKHDIVCFNNTLNIMDVAGDGWYFASLDCLNGEAKQEEMIQVAYDVHNHVAEGVVSVYNAPKKLSDCINNPASALSCTLKVVMETITAVSDMRKNIDTDMENGRNLIHQFQADSRKCLSTVWDTVPERLQQVKEEAAPCFHEYPSSSSSSSSSS